MREFKDVHDAHCCKKHGCKYCDENCTVLNGQNEGIFCEDCYNEPEVTTIHAANGYFLWQWAGVGFGECSFSLKDGKLKINAECMGKEKAKALLYALVDKMVEEATIS